MAWQGGVTSPNIRANQKRLMLISKKFRKNKKSRRTVLSDGGLLIL